MRKSFLFFLFLIFVGTSISQNEQIVTIKGFAPSYVGQTITILEIEDYFSMKEVNVASTVVKEDSNFTVSFFLKETQKILIQPAKNKSYLYVQPGAQYDVYLPEKNKYEVYRPMGNSIEVSFFNLDTADINYKILQFQRWSDEFISTYYHLKNLKPIEFATKLDAFKTNVETYYNLHDSTLTNKTNAEAYFNTFVRFSIASLDNIQFVAERNRYEKHDFYIKYSPVQYRNDAYMNYISMFYEKMVPRLSMETNNRVYLGLLKSSPTLIMRALGNEYTLINVRIREIVMIKALSEEFFSNDFPQTNILTVLDSVANHSLFEANAVIAKNMKERLTQLVQGGKAPDFVLTDANNETKTLSSFRKKHVYLHFYDPSSQKNNMELEPLKNIYETYKDDITFITIYPDKDYTDEQLNSYILTIPWAKYKVENTNPIWKNYKIETFPSYVLLDAYGYVVAAPSLGPMPDGQYQTIDKTFFYIQKTIKEINENKR